LKCGKEADVAESATAECPACGAIYLKVAQALASKQQERAAAAEKAQVQAQANSAREAQRAAYAEEGKRAEQVRRDGDPSRGLTCSACGQADAAVGRVKGTLGLELGLWISGLVLSLFVIGLLMSIGNSNALFGQPAR